MTIDPLAGSNIAKASREGNMMVWLIGAVVLILLVIGGVYYYLNSNKPATPAEQTSTQTTQTPQAKENLEDDLNAIEVGDVDKDFLDVDKDLKNL